MVKNESYEPEQLRKLFIGGLDYRTTDDSLKAYFEKYGEIVDVVVMKDTKTKRSRGFGFVAFSKASMVDDAQKDRPHRIDGRAVDTKRAVSRDEIGKPDASARVKRLFVGGLRDDVEENDLIDTFSEFGEVVSVSMPTEKGSQKKRGFAFIEFDDYDAVDKACLYKNIEVKKKLVNVKKALSKDEIQNRGRGDQRGGSNQPWANQNESSWGNNPPGGWGDRGGNWGNQGGYNHGMDSYGSQGGYGGNQRPWQGGGGPSNQMWNNPGGHGGGGGWGNPSNQYGGGGPGGNWGGPRQSDFGNSYSQSFGGGPMRTGGGFGGSNRSTPYNTGSGGGGGYGSGYGGGGMGGGPGMRRF